MNFAFALKLSLTLALCASLGSVKARAELPPTVLSFGANADGATGLNTTTGDTLVTTPINTSKLAGKTISQIAAGSGHNLLLASDGAVFSLGKNSNGVTGLNTTHGKTSVATPINTTNLAGKTITQVAAGSGLSLLLANDGTVFSFGWNDSGRTGLNTTTGVTSVATPIVTTTLAGKTITQVAAGTGHALLLANDGTVFSFGGNNYGQTGLNTTSGNTLIATPINNANLAGKTIAQVAAGHLHSLLLADDGAVFAFGFNGYGQNGLNAISENTPIATPIDATNLAGKKITQVAAGDTHSLLLADDGTVFAMGANTHGKTGMNATSGNSLIATPIDATNLAGKKIIQVSAGFQHSLLLADDGAVFSLGWNLSGGTGLNTTVGDTLIATPINLTNLAGKLVSQVEAGSSHSLLLTEPMPLPADFNNDARVDEDDLSAWKMAFGLTGNADADADGDSDGADFLTWQRQLGSGVPADTASAAIPEPMTEVLLALAVAGLWKRRG